MNESKELAIRPVSSQTLPLLSETDFNLMFRQAQMIARSGLVPKALATAEKVLVVLMTGRELGLPPMTALRSIDVINNMACIKPQAMIGLIERSGLLEDIQIVDDGQTCSVTMKRVGRHPHTETFSAADAQRIRTKEWEGDHQRDISLAEKKNWKSMPVVMRKWRAIAACARVVFPDVILGLYTTEEIGETRTIDDDEYLPSILGEKMDEQSTGDQEPSPDVIEGDLVPEDTSPPVNDPTPLKPSEVTALIAYARSIRPDLKDAHNAALNKSCLKACGLNDWTEPMPGGLEAAKALVWQRAAQKQQEPPAQPKKPKKPAATQEPPPAPAQQDFPFPDASLEQPCKECGVLTIRLNLVGEPMCQDCANKVAGLS